MSFLINPFVYSSSFANQYSMQTIRTTTVANIERLFINNQSNAIDTALRDSTPNISFSLWFKVDTAANGTQRGLFTKYDDYAGYDRCFLSYLDAANKFNVLTTYDGNSLSVQLQTSQVFSSATWTHLTFVYDNTQTTAANIAKLYINGVENTSWSIQNINTTQKYFHNRTLQTQRAWVTFASRYAGASARLATEGFGGKVDDLTFWDKSLSSTEATELYNSGLAKDISQMSSYSTNCLAWYRMGDATGDVWNGSTWTITNVKETASTNLTSSNLVEADRTTDVY